ncbi:MAG: hypothetical protein ACHQM6_02200 [Candidatus Kapaibacterium sp.]
MLLTTLLLFWGCSAHQISFHVPPSENIQNRLPFWIAISVPDSTENLTFPSTLSGGLCEGHEYQLHIGKGMIDAIREGFRSVCDSVVLFSSTDYEEAGKKSSGKIRYLVTPMIQRIAANVDFSTSAFAVNIKASIHEEVSLTMTNLKRAGDTIPLSLIHVDGEANGTGRDCHEAVPFLKKAGEAAMLRLRDSVASQLGMLHL